MEPLEVKMFTMDPIRPYGARGRPKWSQLVPREAPRSPRGSQGRPKSAKGGPKKNQRGARESKKEPRWRLKRLKH